MYVFIRENGRLTLELAQFWIDLSIFRVQFPVYDPIIPNETINVQKFVLMPSMIFGPKISGERYQNDKGTSLGNRELRLVGDN